MVVITAPAAHPGYYHVDLLAGDEHVTTRRPMVSWGVAYLLRSEGVDQPDQLTWWTLPAEQNPLRSPDDVTIAKRGTP